MHRSISAILTCVWLFFWSGSAVSEQPIRNGFTLELGIGLSNTHLMPDDSDSKSRLGLAPLSISLGGFLNNEMALMFRVSGVSFSEDSFLNSISDQYVLAFYGIHFQYWFYDFFFASAGPSLTRFLINEGFDPNDIFGSGNSDLDEETGFGLSLRAGYSFANWKNHSLRISLELFMSFFDNLKIVGEALCFEWQWF